MTTKEKIRQKFDGIRHYYLNRTKDQNELINLFKEIEELLTEQPKAIFEDIEKVNVELGYCKCGSDIEEGRCSSCDADTWKRCRCSRVIINKDVRQELKKKWCEKC